MAHVIPLRAANSVITTQHKELKKPTSCAKINHTARYQATSGIDGAKALAAIKKRRKRHKHSLQLELCIRNNAVTRKFFRPLEKYLIQKIRQGYTYPHLPTGPLMVILENAQASELSITYSA
jgi:hypothetical protein